LCNGFGGKIVGIEIEETVATETARRLQRWKNVTIQRGDACQLLPEDATLLYMYNPFTADVFRRLIDAIEERFPVHRLRII
jgi:16S rRNA A1518/A1519 N6-dimethyltransferase RsmA/KsgA/DIM1 with predicted DNA glycosylase/AP lyase activity